MGKFDCENLEEVEDITSQYTQNIMSIDQTMFQKLLICY